MEHDQTKISPAQLLLLIVGFILGSNLLTSFMDKIVRGDAWFVILFSFAICVPFLFSYVWLYKLFPGKNFSEVNEIVFGLYLGKVITASYTAFFLLLLTYNAFVLAGFYIDNVMAATPKIAFLIVLALTCAYTVKKGIEAIARVSVFAVVYTAFEIVATTILLAGSMDITHFLPVLRLPVNNYVQSIHICAAIPFCEVIAFVMVFPSLNAYRKAGRYVFGGFAIAAAVMLIIVFRNTAALGPSVNMYANTSYEAARLIDIGGVFTRIELLIAIGITVVLFIKIVILYYATVHSISQLCRVRSPSTLILPLGIIVVMLAINVFPSASSNVENGSLYHPFLAIPFEFVIPPLTLLIAKLRRLPGKKGKVPKAKQRQTAS